MDKELMRRQLRHSLNSVTFLKKDEVQGFIERGKNIELRLAKCDPDNETELVEISYAIIQLESELESTASTKKVSFFIAFALLVMGYGALYVFINKIDILTYLSYILSSMVGALIYFVSSRTAGGADAPLYKILVAIALPFMFISFLFTNGQGQIIDLKDKMLWAFIFGYSSDLLIIFLNKVVTKIKVAIG
ncbi:hypothetical protein HNR77_004246 [Paenibacillus sp. JGP012]|uniref:hypothetical protein n=1 Tax=Paenibacillus sp. JGP012 TaxID=2735914 RepID=UPI001607C8F2|nr:hypothetical protein [Paenibacillus sp. JGP012]MBB6023146.1 hypothetical protein [Paenibacillus sp. JGP012]